MESTTIAILGAHGTGKSTLAKFLAANIDPTSFGFDSLVLCTEVARSCPFPIGVKSDKQAQEWIFARQEEQERRATGLVLADNCLLGQYAYYRYWGGEDATKRELAFHF